ncbi:rRNA pseudouridine synthase [Thermoleophilum album]|uniref:pseudouridine synthase n=1 Tax=Thermoleophilum album TaxID=29539 RepID=UPI00237CA823|nr:pseudouridine synthase [Thermoleophilum album]WDT94384.1 rRNA pseudouridine synthase [Thermoleophilum album]
MRLAKYLARCGVASRRASEQLVRAGRVQVAGQTVTDPARHVEQGVEVTVDGRAVRPEPLEVWVLNKPRGVVSTARDPQGRPTVVDLVPSPRRLYPVGRLDADSTGLLVLTNDGRLAERLMHPRYGVERVYRVRVVPPRVDRSLAERLERGVRLDDGPARALRARVVGRGELEIVMGEGRKREVRRMLDAVGRRVVELERIRIGPLDLAALGLGRGRARRLGEREIALLKRAAGLV